jgi:hypothetical protein
LLRGCCAPRTTNGIRIRAFEPGESPLSYAIRDHAGNMEGGKGMEAFYASVVAADAGDPDTVEPEVFIVCLVYGLGADLFLSLPYASPSLDAGDLRPQRRAGDPKRSRHLAAALVLYDGRTSGWTTGGDPEGPRLTAQLLRYCLVVFLAVSHRRSVERRTCKTSSSNYAGTLVKRLLTASSLEPLKTDGYSLIMYTFSPGFIMP